MRNANVLFFYVNDRVTCKSKVEWGEGNRYGY